MPTSGFDEDILKDVAGKMVCGCSEGLWFFSFHGCDGLVTADGYTGCIPLRNSRQEVISVSSSWDLGLGTWATRVWILESGMVACGSYR